MSTTCVIQSGGEIEFDLPFAKWLEGQPVWLQEVVLYPVVWDAMSSAYYNRKRGTVSRIDELIAERDAAKAACDKADAAWDKAYAAVLAEQERIEKEAGE